MKIKTEYNLEQVVYWVENDVIHSGEIERIEAIVENVPDHASCGTKRLIDVKYHFQGNQTPRLESRISVDPQDAAVKLLEDFEEREAVCDPMCQFAFVPPLPETCGNINSTCCPDCIFRGSSSTCCGGDPDCLFNKGQQKGL